MAEELVGVVNFVTSAGASPVIQVNPLQGDISIGSVGRDGDLTLRDEFR